MVAGMGHRDRSMSAQAGPTGLEGEDGYDLEHRIPETITVNTPRRPRQL